MIVSFKPLGINPFFHAYDQADWLGRAIFLGLIGLSILTWVLVIYKIRCTRQARLCAAAFYQQFQQGRGHPLSLPLAAGSSPFQTLYTTLKEYAVDLLKKNQHFSGDKENGAVYLSPSDIDLIGSHLMTKVTAETQRLESHVYILKMIISLAPFLGLLGTVWGILTTFSDPQALTGSSSNYAVLGGMSLALVTTVLGLLDAIPALIGYHYIRNLIQQFEIEMETFSNEMLASVELQYRQVDLRHPVHQEEYAKA